MLDSFLDWAVVGLPTILSVIGVVVSIRVPHARHHRYWYGGLIATGVVVSGITMWQQYRTRQSHETEVSGLNGSLKQLQTQVTGLHDQTKELTKSHQDEVARRQQAERNLQEQTAAMTQSQQAEVVRRQQAERDLQNLVGAVGNSTRQGVMSDIKSSPIRVEVNGRPTRDPDEIKRVREGLGDYMRVGAQLRDRCRTDAPESRLERDAETWYGEVQTFLTKNLDRSFNSQFTTSKSLALIPGGVAEKRVGLWQFLDQRVETLSKFIDQLK